MTHHFTQSFRNGEVSAKELISSLQSLFDSREPDVVSFLPEANRFERLQKEAEELVARYPDSKNRPPLFGMPIGVKDIFHVDGFVLICGVTD